MGKFDKGRQLLKEQLEALGDIDVEFPGVSASGKALVSFKHIACGTEQVWQAANAKKSLANNPDYAPCSKCGGARRAAKATEGWVAAVEAKRATA